MAPYLGTRNVPARGQSSVIMAPCLDTRNVPARGQ